MTSVSRGRPQASSQETLAEAACELFLEQGYEATTVADITQRAGVSRSTFFNYFDGKAAAIWFALDDYLRETRDARESPLDTAAEALGDAPLGTLALAIANAEAMGVTQELATGRALRQAELAEIIAKTLPNDALTAKHTALERETRSAASAAAIFSAIWGWAMRGSGAHSLHDEIVDALAHGVALEKPRSASGKPLRIAVIGAGAIGGRVLEELHLGNIPGTVLSGVITRRPDALEHLSFAAEITDFGEDLERAIAESDVFVECGGIPSLRAYGPSIIAAGRELLTVSIGALADPEMRAALTRGPGILRLSNGAIGGLDIVAAAARETGVEDGVTAASITTRKKAKSLVQSWMSEEEVERLCTTTEAFVLFSGTVQEAIALFPGSLNIACALAHASGLWDETRVTLHADPHAERTNHRIEVSGAAGEYTFLIENKVSPITPTSSMIVAESVLRGVETLAGKRGSFV